MSKDKAFCSECIEESHVVKHVDSRGTLSTCDYCGESRKTATIGWLAEKVHTIIQTHFGRTPPDPPDDTPLEVLKEFPYERDGDYVLDVISELVGWQRRDISRDICKTLKAKSYDRHDAEMGIENAFDESAQYLENKSVGSGANFEKWHRFEDTLRSESRFFNATASSILEDIFKGVEDIKTVKGAPVLRPLSPSDTSGQLYRARIVRDDEFEGVLKQPDQQLGPPPSGKARLGRMNAAGVSVFYGATSIDTAVAEVRPPVGSRVVAAQFNVVKDLFVLDVKALTKAVLRDSYFSANYVERAEQVSFLKTLSSLCSKAVLPGDEEFEYLTTQALAEFLASNSNIDGIIFPSVQSDGDKENVVLFHKSSRVRALSQDLKMLHRFTGEVYLVPSGERAEETSENGNEDLREASLEIDCQSIKIIDVKGVKHEFSSFDAIYEEDAAEANKAFFEGLQNDAHFDL